MKKRVVFGILIALVAILFTGCFFTMIRLGIFGYQIFQEMHDSEEGRPLKGVNEYGQIVMDAFQNQDVEAVYEIMCPYIQENDTTIKEDIQEMFAFMDGKIISYDEPGQEGGTASKGRIEYHWKFGESVIRNIQTDTRAKYKVLVSVMEVNKKHRDYEGVVAIKIWNQNGFDEEGHYKDDAIFDLYYPELYENSP